MNKSNNSQNCKVTKNVDLRLGDAPPSHINGKKNPEYTRWYRSTPAGKAAVAKWNQSDACKKVRSKYLSTDKGKALARQGAARRYAEQFPDGSRKCVECNSQYHIPDILSRGWTLVGKFGCVCDLCR
jgi:hypothetical protein